MLAAGYATASTQPPSGSIPEHGSTFDPENPPSERAILSHTLPLVRIVTLKGESCVRAVLEMGQLVREMAGEWEQWYVYSSSFRELSPSKSLFQRHTSLANDRIAD